LVIGAASLFGLFALSLLLRVAGWRSLMRGADVLCLLQLGALCVSPGWFAVRLMPIAALAYLTYCVHWAVQWEIAHRRELQRRSLRL
jgi:uncharacterized membrane protein YcaP (DUF421 family)